MAAGRVSEEQAEAIVGVFKKLPDSLSSEQVQLEEKTMIGFAADHGRKGSAAAGWVSAGGDRAGDRRTDRSRAVGGGRSGKPAKPSSSGSVTTATAV